METNSSYSKSNLPYRTNRPRKLGKSYTLKSTVLVPRTAQANVQIYGPMRNTSHSKDTVYWFCRVIQFHWGELPYTEAPHTFGFVPSPLCKNLTPVSDDWTNHGENWALLCAQPLVTGRTGCQTENTRNRTAELCLQRRKQLGHEKLNYSLFTFANTSSRSTSRASSRDLLMADTWKILLDSGLRINTDERQEYRLLPVPIFNSDWVARVFLEAEGMEGLVSANGL